MAILDSCLKRVLFWQRYSSNDLAYLRKHKWLNGIGQKGEA